MVASDTVYVSEFVDLIGPKTDMLGPVRDGGVLKTGTEPACFRPNDYARN
jgi:hypothetical protein